MHGSLAQTLSHGNLLLWFWDSESLACGFYSRQQWKGQLENDFSVGQRIGSATVSSHSQCLWGWTPWTRQLSYPLGLSEILSESCICITCCWIWSCPWCSPNYFLFLISFWHPDPGKHCDLAVVSVGSGGRWLGFESQLGYWPAV